MTHRLAPEEYEPTNSKRADLERRLAANGHSRISLETVATFLSRNDFSVAGRD